MKGNPKVLAELNSLLSEELTAISQYIVHAEMCENWGYGVLHDVAQKRAIDEMKHAEKLIARILFLEGIPIVSELNKITIGDTIPKQVANDTKGEYDAVKHYNAVIALCAQEKDATTKALLEQIEQEEEGHVDTLEAQRDQMQQMGLQVFLSTQTGKGND
jgi:bacterioferritin